MDMGVSVCDLEDGLSQARSSPPQQSSCTSQVPLEERMTSVSGSPLGHNKDHANADQSDWDVIFVGLVYPSKRPKINHIANEEPGPYSPDSTLRQDYDNATSLDWSPERLQRLFDRSIADCSGLPVEHWNYDEAKIHDALRQVLAKHSYLSAFYIGATTDVQRRYLGGESRGSTMPGHCERWLSMIVVHLASGIGARRVETKLILYAKKLVLQPLHQRRM